MGPSLFLDGVACQWHGVARRVHERRLEPLPGASPHVV